MTASPVMPSSVPIAVPRFSTGDAATTIARLTGTTMAPPQPWMTRAQSRKPTPGASAASADPATNTPSPTTSIRRRPNRSPKAAPAINIDANVTL